MTEQPEYAVGSKYIVDCEQNSPEWFAAKLGIPSTSNFSDIMAGGGDKTRDMYLRKMAGEIISGVPRENYSNFAMTRGMEMEPYLRGLYTMITGNRVRPPTSAELDAKFEPGESGRGFVKKLMPFGWIGSSPDGLVGDTGGVEIKSAAPHVLISIIEAGIAPPEHIAQCQGHMMVNDRVWWDIAIGYTGMPLFVRRIERDDAYIDRIEVALKKFQKDLDELVERVRMA